MRAALSRWRACGRCGASAGTGGNSSGRRGESRAQTHDTVTRVVNISRTRPVKCPLVPPTASLRQRGQYRGVRGAHGGQRPRGHPWGAPGRPYSGPPARRRPLGWIPRGPRQAAGGASATTEAGATLGASYGTGPPRAGSLRVSVCVTRPYSAHTARSAAAASRGAPRRDQPARGAGLVI